MNVRIFWVHAMECMCAKTRPRFILSSESVWGENGVRTHVNSKGNVLSTRKILPGGVSNSQRCIKQDSKPNTLLTRYSGPIFGTIFKDLLWLSDPLLSSMKMLSHSLSVLTCFFVPIGQQNLKPNFNTNKTFLFCLNCSYLQHQQRRKGR